MNKQLQKCAEILVESGYAYELGMDCYVMTRAIYAPIPKRVQVFSDTLEGRRQAHAIINHLIKHHFKIWAESAYLDKDMDDFDIFEFTGRRIKWCIQDLTK